MEPAVGHTEPEGFFTVLQGSGVFSYDDAPLAPDAQGSVEHLPQVAFQQTERGLYDGGGTHGVARYLYRAAVLQGEGAGVCRCQHGEEHKDEACSFHV